MDGSEIALSGVGCFFISIVLTMVRLIAPLLDIFYGLFVEEPSNLGSMLADSMAANLGC